MGRLCERPGCSEVGGVGYGFDADRLLVWLTVRDADARPGDFRGGVLCRRHADAMVVPRGWTLDDRREPTPRLFRPAAGDEPAPARKPKRRRAPRPGRSATAESAAAAPVAALPLEPEAPRTVAAVTGAPSPSDDPDETQAIPWMPEFDINDDLGGVLRAETPLLARAFRGTDRPR